MATVTITNALANALLDSTGLNTIFNSGVMELRTGSSPGAAAGATGTLVASISLPADCFGAASAGSIAKAGTWSDTSANADGTIGYFRIKASDDAGSTDGTDERIDGDVSTVAAGTGALQLDNTAMLTGQAVTINTFTISLTA